MQILKLWNQEIRDFRLKFHPYYWNSKIRFRMDLVDGRIAVSEKYRFVYNRIPKSANSTVMRTLIQYENEAFALNYSSSEAKKNFYVKPSRLKFAHARKARTSYFSFTVVRNPYTRLASAYLDKIVRNQEQVRAVRKRMKLADDQPIPFTLFLDYLEQGGLKDDPHWARQCHLLPRVLGELDFIGHVETLDQDMHCIIKRIYGDVDQGEVKSWNPHGTSASEKLGHLFENETLIERARQLYLEDFKAFGYSDAFEDALLPPKYQRNGARN